MKCDQDTVVDLYIDGSETVEVDLARFGSCGPVVTVYVAY